MTWLAWRALRASVFRFSFLTSQVQNIRTPLELLQKQLRFDAGAKEVKDRTHSTRGCGTLGSVREKKCVRGKAGLKDPRYNEAINRRAGAKMFWGSKAAFSLCMDGAPGRSRPRMGISRLS